MRIRFVVVLLSTLLLSCGNGSSQDVTVNKGVIPRIPSSICKSFTDNSTGVKLTTWCDYFDNPGSHPCTEVVINSGSSKTICYFDPLLPENDLVKQLDLPKQKGGLVAYLVKENESEAITVFKAYSHGTNGWKLAASAEGRLFDGMGENSYYISSGKFVSAGCTPDSLNESIEWQQEDGVTNFSKSVNGVLYYDNHRDEAGGYDRIYDKETGKMKSETIYTAVKDYDRLFGEEFIRYEISENKLYE